MPIPSNSQLPTPLAGGLRTEREHRRADLGQRVRQAQLRIRRPPGQERRGCLDRSSAADARHADVDVDADQVGLQLAYLEQVVLPNLVAGDEQADRSRADIDVVHLRLLCDVARRPAARRWAAGLAACCATVRAHEPLFESHGFLDEARRCQAAFRAGDEQAMIDAVPDNMVDALTIAGTPDEVRERLRRYEGLADAIKLSPPTH